MGKSEWLGPYRLAQSDGVFKLGQDTLKLGGFTTVRRGDRVCDLGCGSGALLLLLAGRTEGLRLTGMELASGAAELARRNLAENGLGGEILTGDLREIRSLLPTGQWDLTVSNPPYFPAGAGRPGGAARTELTCTLDQVCAAAGWLLRNGGRFSLVHRPERLADLFAALRGYGLEPKRMQLIQHSAGTPPSAVLVEAVRQGKPGLSVLPAALTGRGNQHLLMTQKEAT